MDPQITMKIAMNMKIAMKTTPKQIRCCEFERCGISGDVAPISAQIEWRHMRAPGPA
ncbi:MAG TPA: hypothetical protein VEK07_22135 [Polyangiaceae bacterium]|nr:hypothetical protein [Polyangiaceae bacterium]